MPSPLRSTGSADSPAPSSRVLHALSDDELETRVARDRDRDALAVLLTRLRPLVAHAIHRVVQNPQAVQDVIQDTSVRALGSLHRFRGDAKVSTWLYAIAYYAARSHVRSTARMVPTDNEALLDRGEGAFVRAPRPALRTPERTAIRKERRALLHDALDELPDTYREIIELRDLKELSTRESAAEVGISESNVRVRLHRARCSLAALLAPRLDRAA